MLDRFGISRQDLDALVDVGLASGGNWCDLYFEDTASMDLLLRDGIVGTGSYSLDFGCGVRVLCGEKTGYAYAETTDMNSLRDAAKAASAIAAGSFSSLPFKAADSVACAAGLYDASENPWHLVSASDFVPFLEGIESRIRALDSRVSKVTAMLSWTESNILMYNSLREICEDSRPLGSISITTIFDSGGRIESTQVSRSLRHGAGMLSDSLAAEIAAKAVKGVDALFEAKRPSGGEMTVVMAAGASGILLHEAMGHAFEADFNRKGQSVFSDRMGKRICRRGINIVDDGTLPGNRGACLYDDEGVPGQKTYMVRDGVLTSFLHDRISAAWYGVTPTGNGRRESFRYNPIPRMRATYMENGSDASCAAELISDVRKGVYVDSFSNGQVKIGEGDFTFYVKSGFLIENGRLSMPVKDINIIGNGPEALADITAVASDCIIDDGTWTCGKGQSVPVSCGMPSVVVGKLIVGGE